MKYSKAQPGVSRDKMRKAREREEADRSEVASKTRTKSSQKIRRPVGRLLNGPRHGQVRYVRDLEHEVRIGERTGVPFDYQATKRTTRLPDKMTEGQTIEAAVWKWIGPVERPTYPSTPPLEAMTCASEGCDRALLHPATRARGVCAICQPIPPAVPAGWGES